MWSPAPPAPNLAVRCRAMSFKLLRVHSQPLVGCRTAAAVVQAEEGQSVEAQQAANSHWLSNLYVGGSRKAEC